MSRAYIGEYTILDWDMYASKRLCSRECEYNAFDAIDLRAYGCNVDELVWTLEFNSKLAFLETMYDGPISFSSLDAAKQCVDEFLERISQMKAFW